MAVVFQAHIVDPSQMNLREWSGAFVYTLTYFLALPWLQSEDQDSWVKWATQIAQEPFFLPFNLPYPGPVEDWKIWAMGVNRAISTVGSL